MNQSSSSSPSTSSTYSFRPGFRSRQSHQKSRNGCLTCKQRRKKCDEQRPYCTSCRASLRICVYATEKPSLKPSESVVTSSSSVPCDSSATSWSSVPSPLPPLSEPFSRLLARSTGPFPWFSVPTHALTRVGTDDAVPGFTDADLYFHYLNHTCKQAPSFQKDRLAMQVGTVTLALYSELVSHNVLALSAACLCKDIMSNGSADPDTVSQLLDTGLQHHTLALEQWRTMSLCPGESDVQPLLASALLMCPFAFAFQHIQHWVLFTKGSQSTDILTPRDAVMLLRGIFTTILALDSIRADSICAEAGTPWSSIFPAQITDSKDGTSIPERSHPMFPCLAATFNQALSQLQGRFEYGLTTPQADEKSASVFGMYDILSEIMSCIFSDTQKPDTYVGFPLADRRLKDVANVTKFMVDPDSLLAQAPAWLANFVLREPGPGSSEQLVRWFLSFFRRAPVTYINLVLPLLDSPTDNTNNDHQLTTVEVLALDLYAHWLVLMLLVENEAWWVGEFPFLALQGLIARYGDKFSGMCSSGKQWWPAGMLEAATRLKQWK